jgi:hypothetical protein
MPFLLADRCKESTTTTGTGTISLGGVTSGLFRTLVSGYGTGKPVLYTIEHQSANEWEVGYGVVTSGSPDTLTRVAVFSSSNSNALVNFSAGTKHVWGTDPAANGTQIANVMAFGAKGDGTTDDQPAFVAALASGAKVVYVPPNTYRLSAGISIPDGVTLYSDGLAPSNPPSGTILLFDLSVATCVTVGTPGPLTASLRGVTINRAAGTVPAGSKGVLVDQNYNTILEDVLVRRCAIGFHLKGNAGSGVVFHMNRCFTGWITDTDLLLDNVPEVQVSDCRFGMNTSTGLDTDVAHTNYVKITGSGGAATNTIVFLRCQFNTSDNNAQVTNLCNFENFVAANWGEFTFIACHAELFNNGFVSNSGTPTIRQLTLTSSSFFPHTAGNVFAFNAATALWQAIIQGCRFTENASLSLTPTASSAARLAMFGNEFNCTSTTTFTGSTTLGLCFLHLMGNWYTNGLAVAGAWTQINIDADYVNGTFTDTATGAKYITDCGGGIGGKSGFVTQTPANTINYWQASGNTTGNPTVLEALGSDTNVDAVLRSKGTSSSVRLQVAGTTILRCDQSGAVDSNVLVRGTAAAAQFYAEGVPANVNFELIPKGTGVVRASTGFGCVPTLLIPSGLFPANLTTVTALTAGQTVFVYAGRAPSNATTVTVLFRLTTATSAGTQWQEVAIFKGATVAGGNASLTRLGFTAFTNTVGLRVHAVTLSGCVQGDDIWVALATQGNTPGQFRGCLADDIQSGTIQVATVRPSLASSPQATTLASATFVPPWVALKW